MKASRLVLLLIVPLVLGLGFLGFVILEELNQLEQRLGEVDAEIRQTGEVVESAATEAARALEQSDAALNRALTAEARAREAALLRDAAQIEAAQAEARALAASSAADEARVELDRVRRERQQELDRLEQALGDMVDTRRTAIGLVMNLGSDAIEFAFDEAVLAPGDRELLSRIAGVLLTSAGYRVYVYGHTDDIGSEAYNLALSERRAESVRDYLVQAGIDPSIITTQGFGKSSPKIADDSSEARAMNRRVEIGIVDVQLDYQTQQAGRDR